LHSAAAGHDEVAAFGRVQAAPAAKSDQQVGAAIASRIDARIDVDRCRVLSHAVEYGALDPDCLKRPHCALDVSCSHDVGIRHDEGASPAGFERKLPEPVDCVFPEDDPRPLSGVETEDRRCH
jgi:hypothetical protein